MTVRVGDTSEESARRFVLRHEQHTRFLLRRRHPRPARISVPRPSRRESAAVLDEIIWRYVGRFPRSGRSILDDVRDDYGSVDDRRFWLRLASLQRRGAIEHTPDGYRRRR